MNKKKVKRRRRKGGARVDRLQDRGGRDQAAYERGLSYALCDDLARKFARLASGGFTNYALIATEFLRLRPTKKFREGTALSELLREKYETDAALKKHLRALDKWIYKYIVECIDYEPFDRGDNRQKASPTHGKRLNALARQLDVAQLLRRAKRPRGRPKKRREAPFRFWLFGCRVNADLLTPLSLEYVRDRKTLMAFLSAMFKRWREIFKPNSLWRARFVTQQTAAGLGYDHKRILERLQKIGAVPSNLTGRQTYAWLSTIGQWLSRDQRTALGKDFGFARL
jgi:hypothetical protein